jgi:peptidoglycan hydrolase-like protein with peptidoglycan-binding domain
MRRLAAVIGWLPVVLLSACMASQTAAPTAGRERPAVDRLLTRGDIQVAQMHVRAFGFDPGPIDGLYTAQTQAAVQAYQAQYGLPASGLLDYTTRLQLIPGLDYDRGEDR